MLQLDRLFAVIDGILKLVELETCLGSVGEEKRVLETHFIFRLERAEG